MKKVTKSEARKLLKNRKFFVGNQEISEKVQKQLFKAGFKWNNDESEVLNIDFSFMYTDSDKIMLGEEIDFYERSDKKEISTSEIIDLDIVPYKPTFKPFDKVLVRDWEALGTWVCGIYSHYNEETGKHITSGGFPWNFCIPFEGNESLLGTDKSPEENKQ